jgi:primosomal protein N' (replication factor Y)
MAAFSITRALRSRKLAIWLLLGLTAWSFFGTLGERDAFGSPIFLVGALVLASATPSLESRHNVTAGKTTALTLAHRAGSAGLPQGILVDLRKEGGARTPGDVTFSQPLKDELDRALSSGEQVILLRNRRGYAPVYLCRACGEDHRCDECGIPRTHHQRQNRLVCHYCGSAQPLPVVCAACGEGALQSVGSGTERVEESFVGLYPEVATAVLDRDTVRQSGGAAAVLDRFGRGEAQVLIGTQMVSKGHHFPKVGLAVVLAADSYLGFPDFRAVERTYTLLAQLGGRAGRGDLPGRVVIQTYYPDHPAVVLARKHDVTTFLEEELVFRRSFDYPPVTRLGLIRFESTNERLSREAAEAAAQAVSPVPERVRLRGPAPAPLERIRSQWRWQLLISAANRELLRQLLEKIEEVKVPRNVRRIIDVDPASTL